MQFVKTLSWASVIVATTACSGGGGADVLGLVQMEDTPAIAQQPELIAPAPDPVTPDPVTPDPVAPQPVPTAEVPNTPVDTQLRALIIAEDLSGDASLGKNLPSINDPLAQLGRELFFSKSLGGDFDSACVSCHHPNLGGADALMLPVGVGAIDPELLGPGRQHGGGLPNVPRHSPTVFNAGLWEGSLFWDSRIEALNNDIDNPAIRTPDSNFDVADPNAGANLVAAQARFPVTSAEEMRSDNFETGADNEQVRAHLAARIGNYGIAENELGPNLWLGEFQVAFNSAAGPEELITFDHIALALAAYERSMVFTNNAWKAYVEGDNTALSDQQKQGAVLFFTPADDNGGGCSSCHSGDLFSDESHHIVAFPQFGHGKGDGNDDDFGRERETRNSLDRYRFRTPSLLNIAATAPYGHAGVYPDLNAVLNHYNNERDSVDDFFDDTEWCDTVQFNNVTNCGNLYPNAQANSNQALRELNIARQNGTAVFENTNINNNERNQIVAFLQALTDPCVLDQACLAPWIPDTANTGPDGQRLNGIDDSGDFL